MARNSKNPISKPLICSALAVAGIPLGWLLVVLALYLPWSAQTCVIIAVVAAAAVVVAAFLSRTALWMKCISVGMLGGSLLAAMLALTWSTIPG
ncbi:hypothetical protein HNP40_003174 [Mycobacteroides chelonae]|nr:hypothetical protein [Mycobacteroides chelonae]